MTAVVTPAPPQTVWPGLLASVGGEAGVRRLMSAHSPIDGASNKWEEGFSFLPLICGGSEHAPLDPCDMQFTLTDSDLPAQVENRPVVFWEAVKCSSLSNDPDYLSDQARLKLELTTSYQLETELWTGAGAIALGFTDNQFLASAGSVAQLNGGVAAPAAQALGILQDAIAIVGAGRRSMIHCTPATANAWLQLQVVFREPGGLLSDLFGNVVVPGTGYTGSAPDGTDPFLDDTAWAYATPLVEVRLSDIEIVTREIADRMDFLNNVDAAIAWRTATATWDDCYLLGINVDKCQLCCVAS